MKENSSDKGCFKTKKSVLAKAPPFSQHSSINFDVILKTRGKFLNFIKNVIQLCHGLYIYKLKENINYIYKIYIMHHSCF